MASAFLRLTMRPNPCAAFENRSKTCWDTDSVCGRVHIRQHKGDHKGWQKTHSSSPRRHSLKTLSLVLNSIAEVAVLIIGHQHHGEENAEQLRCVVRVHSPASCHLRCEDFFLYQGQIPSCHRGRISQCWRTCLDIQYSSESSSDFPCEKSRRPWWGL